MSTKVAINGLGRIGRATLKILMDEPALDLVAVNDLTDAENLAYLLRFDTVYGRYSRPVEVEGHDLVIAGRKIRTLKDVVEARKTPINGFHEVEFQKGDSLSRIILDATEADAATRRVAQRYGIPEPERLNQ